MRIAQTQFRQVYPVDQVRRFHEVQILNHEGTVPLKLRPAVTRLLGDAGGLFLGEPLRERQVRMKRKTLPAICRARIEPCMRFFEGALAVPDLQINHIRSREDGNSAQIEAERGKRPAGVDNPFPRAVARGKKRARWKQGDVGASDASPDEFAAERRKEGSQSAWDIADERNRVCCRTFRRTTAHQS